MLNGTSPVITWGYALHRHNLTSYLNKHIIIIIVIIIIIIIIIIIVVVVVNLKCKLYIVVTSNYCISKLPRNIQYNCFIYSLSVILKALLYGMKCSESEAREGAHILRVHTQYARYGTTIKSRYVTPVALYSKLLRNQVQRL